ncbi:cysteine proteinase [Auriculariales sp. MPI-PUGE-AT-0066]|nr:cysteine proteinase [Auriculariales sp. MPI-PUGE-AT-0066]
MTNGAMHPSPAPPPASSTEGFFMQLYKAGTQLYKACGVDEIMEGFRSTLKPSSGEAFTFDTPTSEQLLPQHHNPTAFRKQLKGASPTSQLRSVSLQSTDTATDVPSSSVSTLEDTISRHERNLRFTRRLAGSPGPGGAVQKSRSLNGFGQRHQHIFQAQHQRKVKENIEKDMNEAWSLRRQHGYNQDTTTFNNYILYSARLLQDKDQESKGKLDRQQLQDSINPPEIWISRALAKAKATLSSLPPALDKEVDALFAKTGSASISKWLNDEIINFYGAMILERSNAAGKEKGKRKGRILDVHYFNTFFWPKLNEGYEKSKLAKWTKRIDIFAKDVVLVPVNHSNSHWTAGAINFRSKRIESYDSMGIRRPNVLQMLRKYVEFESMDKRKTKFDWTDWTDYDAGEDAPGQENCYDCGVFTCQFLESISRGENKFNFLQKDMPYLRRRMVCEIGRAALLDDAAS